MITVFEKNNQLNIIHCVMGDPTDMQLDFEGAIMIDISPMIADANPHNPIVLKINRCQNEERLVAKLTMDKMMREMNNQKVTQVNPNEGKCIKCGQVGPLAVVDGKVLNVCKECYVIDEHIKQKQNKEETIVELSEQDKKLIQSISNSINKKPIRKKCSSKAKNNGGHGAKNDIQ